MIEKVKLCSLHYLALVFISKDSTVILEYTDSIRGTQLMFHTKLCLDLHHCYLTGVSTFSGINQILFSLRLYNNRYSNECQQQIAKHITALEDIHIYHMRSEIIFSALSQATQLKALILYNIPNEYYEQLLTVLPNFSNLQEIATEYYSLLPALSNLSNITYLLFSSSKNSKQCLNYYLHSPSLLQLIFENRNTLKYLYLDNSYSILTDMDIFLNCIALCTNFVGLLLERTKLTPEDISLWSNTVNNMKALVRLYLHSVTLYDTGLESLCAGLAYHTNIKGLYVTDANLTSLSCETLIQLIPTITQLEELNLSDLEDEEAYKLLQQTADAYSINLMERKKD